MATIKQSVIPELRGKIDAVTAKPDGIPGVAYYAVNRDGDVIFQHTSGKIGKGKEQPMTDETVFWIASCTKMLTGIAAMQLVEQGKLSLDDAEQVGKICPELKSVQVLDEAGKLVPKNKAITLRMLLTHTAGFSYSFLSQKLQDHYGPAGLSELSGDGDEILSQPLVNQPGEQWGYSICMDWVGVLVERVSGLRLNEYMQQNIFKPMGLNHISMFPTEEMKKQLAYIHVREADGSLSLYPEGHLLRKALTSKTKEERDAIFNSGGGGCFGRPIDYVQIVSMLLNDGVHAKTGAQILKKDTIKEMFTNQIPEMPNFARVPMTSVKPLWANSAPELYPESHDIPHGWGLSFFLHLKDSMVHSKGTGWWAGLPNLFWWADREKGLGGIIASQIIPFGDPNVMGLWGEIEAGLYQNLESDGLVDKMKKTVVG